MPIHERTQDYPAQPTTRYSCLEALQFPPTLVCGAVDTFVPIQATMVSRWDSIVYDNLTLGVLDSPPDCSHNQTNNGLAVDFFEARSFRDSAHAEQECPGVPMNRGASVGLAMVQECQPSARNLASMEHWDCFLASKVPEVWSNHDRDLEDANTEALKRVCGFDHRDTR